MEKFEFKKDKYSQARGGNSLFLEIFCANCNAKILVYQKDGPGNLLRMYCDRILLPHGLVELLLIKKRKQDITNLICKGCGKILALPMMYERESRLAYRVVHGAIIKKNETKKYLFTKKQIKSEETN